jgi:N-acetylmuramoyl-L-alanine amidase
MTWNDFKKSMLALVLWREGENQGREGMRAIGHVIANRVSGGQGDWLDVIEAKWQFSSISAPGDATLTKWPRQNGNYADAMAFETAMQIADLIMSGTDPDITQGATHYANLHVCDPKWAHTLLKTAEIGAHTFFA